MQSLQSLEREGRLPRPRPSYQRIAAEERVSSVTDLVDAEARARTWAVATQL